MKECSICGENHECVCSIGCGEARAEMETGRMGGLGLIVYVA